MDVMVRPAPRTRGGARRQIVQQVFRENSHEKYVTLRAAIRCFKKIMYTRDTRWQRARVQACSHLNCPEGYSWLSQGGSGEWIRICEYWWSKMSRPTQSSKSGASKP